MADSISDPQLFQVLKERINSYFEAERKNRKGDRAMWRKIGIISMVPVAGYIFLLVFGERSLMLAFIGYLVYIIGSALFVVNIAHDASHQAISTKRSINQLLSFSWNIVGISKYLWEIKHHHSHHIYTNIPHADVDIAESPLLRFSPAYPYKNYYKHQFLYAIPLYGLFGIFIVFVKDFVLLYGEKVNGKGAKTLPAFFFGRLVFTKLLFLLVAFVVPLLVLPYAWWQVLLMFLVCLAVGGALMLLVLVVPHINEVATLADDNFSINNRNAWVLHQIHCTVDSSPNSKLLGWLSGGLNTHLIHHLFPNICHIHYINLTRIVKQTLQERGIPYHEKSFAMSLYDHFKYLRVLGQPSAVLQQLAVINCAVSFIRDGNL
ncbi:fatty acid desaturase family protein [Flavihumibacter fluvii]|uniref:fatty acid desaturase family protein n=1 Tax=Flavihumibacter fluvii TaxID=2838157 RepID=UPI001BDEF406|nr:acyl-CoA desaturase [Flavihumibacter fluvii]ULQ50854.1 acyl-CoA desaturase [Flavihumibacter fluvii]